MFRSVLYLVLLAAFAVTSSAPAGLVVGGGTAPAGDGQAQMTIRAAGIQPTSAARLKDSSASSVPCPCVARNHALHRPTLSQVLSSGVLARLFGSEVLPSLAARPPPLA